MRAQPDRAGAGRPGLPGVREKDKCLGGVNELTRPLFTQYFNQVTPENAGKWGSAAGHDAHRGDALGEPRSRPTTSRRPTASPSSCTCSCGATSSPAGLSPCPQREQREEIEEWYSEVAAPLPGARLHRGRQRAATRSPRLQARGGLGGNYVAALGGVTARRGWDWVLESFRLARQSFPSLVADAQ